MLLGVGVALAKRQRGAARGVRFRRVRVQFDRPQARAFGVVQVLRARVAVAVEEGVGVGQAGVRSEEHTSELQSLMRISYAVFCLKKKKNTNHSYINTQHRVQ